MKKLPLTLIVLVGCFFGILVLGLLTSTRVYAITNPRVSPTATSIELRQSELVVVKEQVLAIVSAEGISTAKVDKLIFCESTWNPEAVHLNRNGSNDMGLWQINSVHGLPDEVRLDPVKSTEFAVYLIKKHGFKPWVCG